MVKEAYKLYVEVYGRVQSGGQLSSVHYGETDANGKFVQYDERRHLAISLAAQDVKKGMLLRSKADFEAHINKLLESDREEGH